MAKVCFLPGMFVSVGSVIEEELAARGMTTREAAKKLDGDPEENELWMDLMSCPPLWERHRIIFTRADAERLEQVFDVPADFFLNIHVNFEAARNEVPASD